MPKGTKILNVDNLLTLLDIDEGVEEKKEVPVNCIFVGANEITKDTGIENFGNVGTGIIQSLYSFVKKNGTKYFIRNLGTVLQKYNPTTGNFEDVKTELADGKRFGYEVYEDWLYMGNGVNNYMRYNGVDAPTEYPTAPKGNILTMFEDRMHIAGNPTEPLTIYYSAIGDPTSFPTANVIKPPGTDRITGLVKYYNTLIVLKEKSVWRIEYVWDGTNWIPKLQVVSENYGSISPKAYCWVENDIWFFTGKEVRRIAWLIGRGEAKGILGFDPTSLSNQIKEALKLLNEAKISESAVFYHDKKFYLAVPFRASTFNDTIFVCHILYENRWTKFNKRKKARANCFVLHDGNVYSAASDIEGRVYKWTANYDDAGEAISAYVSFRQVGGENFNITSIYRYLDVEFKNINSQCEITLIFDDFDERKKRTKVFYLTTDVQTAEDTIGEVSLGELWIADGFGEEILLTEYLKRRFSFLEKGQTIKIKISNNELGGTFTLSKLGLEWKERARRYFAPSGLIYVK